MNTLKSSGRAPWRTGVVASVVAASLLLTGCTGDAEGESRESSSIVVGFTGADVSLDPNLTIATNWLSVLSNMYDSLVMRNGAGELVASLATEWKQTDDLTWTITLRDDVVFQDGTPFTADDVVFTIERVLGEELKSPQRTYIASIASATAVDPTTVEITTSNPFPLLIENLQLIPIVSAAFVEDNGAEALSRGANGTGPYALESWTPGGDLTLSAFADNWRGAPAIAEATFRDIPETGARVSALQAREVDIAVNIAPESAQLLEGDSGLRIESVTSQRSLYLVFDNLAQPLDDVRVRQALNYAVDAESIVDNLLMGYGEVIPSLLGSMYNGHNADLDPYGYDPEKAKDLLAEAGYPDGFTLTVNAPADRYNKDREIAQAIAGQLSEIGVTVDLQITEWGAYLDRYGKHDLGPAYLIGFGTPVWDYSGVFNSYLKAASPQAYFRDDALEAAVVAAARISDPDERAVALSEINEKLYEEAAFLFLFGYQDIYGVADDVDWSARSDEKIWLFDASFRG